MPPLLPPLPPGVAAGRRVTVRDTLWHLQRSVDHLDCRELHLQAADGGTRVLLWPCDRPAPQVDGRALRVLSLRAWARRVAGTLARKIDPRSPRGSFHGEVIPFQLAPVVAVASGASRVLLADEVGLGKTVQAGWIAADLLAREPAARALVAVPAGLREQWVVELRRLFALEVARVDAAWLRAAVADRPADVSPWAAPGIYLGSVDFLKRADVAHSLVQVTWDLLVVDEAHAATAPTDRHAVVAQVADVARCVVIITATPYSGDRNAFTSMLSLGSCGAGGEPLMFRRSRDDVGDGSRRRHRFVTVRVGHAEFRLQRLLERYSREVWREAATDADGARLAMTVLRKRALSSPVAALRSLVRRQELLQGVSSPPRQLTLFDDELDADDTLPEAALAAPGLADTSREGRWLSTLVEAARRAAAADSKARWLGRLLARLGAEPVIVFTEYRDTLRRLAEAIPHARHLHGGLSPGERAAVQRWFNDEGGVLLATDAAAEGLNLQQRCRLLVNYELPWNPARLEQRIGRIDRIGQRRAVHAVSLVARDTAEDLVVAALARRLGRVAATLGQRDRLASLLDEARTARAVITGVTLELPDPAVAEAAPSMPDPPGYPLDTIARSLESGPSGKEQSPGVWMSGLRARGVLRPGAIALVRAAALAEDTPVAERPFLVHVPSVAITRPRTRAEARERGRAVLEIVERVAIDLADVRDWFAGAAALHRQANASRAQRERALLRRTEPRVERQPGLFEGRVLLETGQAVDAAVQRRHEHERRLLALDAAREPRLECRVLGVLLLWR
ncbi:MAG TPA: helicase-related protein [Vicinamibacterales bacterium]